jgi:predicted metalloendopeptidase
VIGNIYLQQNSIDKTQVNEIVENVRDSLAEIIHNTTWLSDESKSKLVDKIRSIIVRSVHPNYFEQEPFLERLTMDNYLRNLNIVRRYFATKNFEIWTKQEPNRDFIQRFGAPLTEVNAFYSPISNTITIFAGLLNKPFYDTRFPKVALYAIIGMVSGHELGHAIDNTGRLFDKEGSLSRTEPWSDGELKEFKNRTKRLMNEYQAPHGCNNARYGEQTIGEDIADVIGVRSAYHAWLKAQPNATKQEKQWFFQIFAQSWAENYDQEHLCDRVNNDVHAIAFFRVDKTLRQLKEFREVFHCKPGDNMVNNEPAILYGE